MVSKIINFFCPYLEGGEAIENKLENLYHFINRGLFYLGPTWNHSLDWVSSNYDEKFNKKLKTVGLNDFEKKLSMFAKRIEYQLMFLILVKKVLGYRKYFYKTFYCFTFKCV